MTFTASVADTVTGKIPPILQAETHAIGDMVVGGAFLAAAVFLWRSNRKAAVAAGIMGGMTLGSSALTDYSGRGNKPLSLRNHRKIDLGIAAIAGAVPTLLSLKESREQRIFGAGAVAMTALTNLTKFRRARRY